MRHHVGVAALAIACCCALPVTAQPKAQGFPTDPAQLEAMMNGYAPLLAHETAPATRPYPDYFGQAARLTEHLPTERAALPRRPPRGPSLVVLPVQTEAFGFGAPFLALLGAELDMQLQEKGLSATRQTDAVDAHGPFVRRFDEVQLANLQNEYPEQRLVMLHAGHDGIDKFFLSLVVSDRQGKRVVQESLVLPESPEAALLEAGGALARMLASAGLAGTAPGARETAGACEAAHWQLGVGTAPRSPRQQACEALVVGMLLPDFGTEWPPTPLSTPARLAWLARAHASATRSPAGDELAQSIRALAMQQLGFPASLPAPSAASASDPVVGKLMALARLDRVDQAPVQSTREERARRVGAIVRDIPAFASVLVGYRGELLDAFGEIDLCEIELVLPGAMPRERCRATPGRSTAPARSATPIERLAYQEWRIAGPYRDLFRLSQSLGRRQATDALIASLPADLAAHPFVDRQVIRQAQRPTSSPGFDDALAATRRSSQRILSNHVNLQRGDTWARRWSISERPVSSNMNIVNDDQVRVFADDELRLMSVMKFDRFVDNGLRSERRVAGERAFFLAPDRGQVQFAKMQATMKRTPMPAASKGALGSAPIARVPNHPFGQSLSNRGESNEAALADRVAASPLDLDARLRLALYRIKRGGSVADAVTMISARPDDKRRDERIGESHAWATPAHAFFFSGELEAAGVFYEKVIQIGTGSDSDLLARSRLPQIAGQWTQMLEASQRRLQRYDTEAARRDVAALMFMRREPASAWQTLLPRIAASDTVNLWHGAMVGHRIEGADIKQVDAWIVQNRLEKSQVDHADADRLYQHLLSVIDRVPTEAQLARLKQRGASVYTGTQPRLAASALLLRSALTGTSAEEARKAVLDVVMDENGQQNRFLMPGFTWVAWQATNGRETLLDAVRALNLDSDFYGLLSKSMLLAQEAEVDESLKYLRAARFELSQIGLGSSMLQSSTVPAPYQWALAGILMHRKTGREEYRQEVLRMARAYQRVQPYFGWPFAVEALYEKEPERRRAAACRARFLDRQSFFLGEARVSGLDDAQCRRFLW